jgi:hypothetical protein
VWKITVQGWPFLNIFLHNLHQKPKADASDSSWALEKNYISPEGTDGKPLQAW